MALKETNLQRSRRLTKEQLLVESAPIIKTTTIVDIPIAETNIRPGTTITAIIIFVVIFFLFLF